MKKIIPILTATCLFASGCSKTADGGDSILDALLNLGYTGNDDLSTVPTSTTFGLGDAADLPSSVDLEAKFPPTGDQGQFGTCVAWAVAYNYKTAIDGITKGLNSSQLANSTNQFSPKDIFTALPDNQKGANCNGTDFTLALNLAQQRGIAHMSTAPYTNLGNCAQSGVDGSWTADANQNKIKSWRKIEATKTAIQQNLANNIPVMLGARLGDNFVDYTGGTVISSAGGYDRVGIHAYHALVIAGYDNNKGPNGAFKIINSWSDNWGESGNVWIDYNYFFSEFCKDSNGDSPLFTAVSDGGSTPPDNNPPSNTGVDVASWANSDVSLGGVGRELDFNIYNIGNQSANPSADWSVYYIYYNAYDANDYNFIFHDDFNTSIPNNTYNCPDNNCVLNATIPAGGSLAELFDPTYESIVQTYAMPNISGQYYLLLVADAYDDFTEQDEMNNYFYTTDYPKTFVNGASNKGAVSPFEFYNQQQPDKTLLKKNEFNTAVRPDNLNAYRTDEIMEVLRRDKKSGKLAKKLAAFKQLKTTTTITFKKK